MRPASWSLDIKATTPCRFSIIAAVFDQSDRFSFHVDGRVIDISARVMGFTLEGLLVAYKWLPIRGDGTKMKANPLSRKVREVIATKVAQAMIAV